MNSAFGITALQSFAPIFNEVSQEFVKLLKPNLNGKEFDLLEYAVNATLDSICCELFSYNSFIHTGSLIV